MAFPQRRNGAGFLVLLERIHHLAHTAHTSNRLQQVMHFGPRNRPTDPHATSGCVHSDGMRMGNESSELRPHPFDQHDVVDRSLPQRGASACNGASGPLCEITYGGAHSPGSEMRRMGELVLH